MGRHKCQFHPGQGLGECGNNASRSVWLGDMEKYIWVCGDCWDQARALWKELEDEDDSKGVEY
jgi:hypothetical protein